jgi:uncharacterized protein YbbC (DUF1343 family)
MICFALLFGEVKRASAQRIDAPVVGAERMDTLLPLLAGKRVGLVVNQTSVVGPEKRHLLDTLLSQGVNVKRIFAPEHGFRGTEEAGAKVKHDRDTSTGLPVASLYGAKHKPSPEQLHDLDLIVFDIQDVGTRFFTYISTMHCLMEACAELRKPFIILDRPNPNDYVDGPVRERRYRSFVGMHPIPVLHGLTIGELAQMINGEGWLTVKNVGNSKGACPLIVVKMERWRHGDPYQLPVKPSPNLPNRQSILLYPSLCFFEGTGVSVGRGTCFPFQALGYPDASDFTFTFTPVPIPGYDSDPIHKNTLCYGVDLRAYPFEGGLSLYFLLEFYDRLEKDGKTFFTRAKWFDLLAGSATLRTQIMEGVSADAIRASWKPGLDKYKKLRAKYLLYPDYPGTIKN